VREGVLCHIKTKLKVAENVCHKLIITNDQIKSEAQRDKGRD